jgi:hypothetical protein
MLFSNRNALSGMNAMITLFVLALLIVTRGVSAAADSNTTPSTTNESCASSVSLNNTTANAQAKENALGSSAYSQGILGYYNATYSSIFQIGHFTEGFPGCTHVVQSDNVVFLLHNSTGGIAGLLVVAETPSLVVSGFVVRTQIAYANTNNPIWAGQEVQAISGGQAQTIEDVGADWTQPTPSPPSDSGDVGCGTPETCNLALWVGLIDNSQGQSDNHLDQAGTIANCNTSSSSSTTCSSYTYDAFYEVLDQEPIIECNSTANGGDVSLYGGDSVTASVENEAFVGGNSYYYDFYVEDTSDSSYCNMEQEDPDMNAPTYAEAMAENYEQGPINGVYVKLADFSNPSFSDATIYLTSTSYGTFNDYTTASTNMYNQHKVLDVCTGGTTDVTAGSLNQYGDFSLTWDTSINTPYWGVYCDTY